VPTNIRNKINKGKIILARLKKEKSLELKDETRK
jgi:hypothetical protein